MFKKSIIVLLVISTISFAAPAEDKNVKKLMEITGAKDMSMLLMKQMSLYFKKMDPNVPNEFWDDMLKEVDSNEIVTKIIPVYKKYFTNEDILKAIEFYESDTGKKFVSHQGKVFNESRIVGEEWGKEIGLKVLKKYEEKYGNK